MVSFVKANMLDAFDNIQSFTIIDNPSKINPTIKTNASTKTESTSLVDELLEKFAQSFSKGSKPDEKLEQDAKYIIDLVDKDKNGTVSLDELSKFDSTKLPSEIGTKISDLCEKFKIYDRDRSGELGLAEIKSAIGKTQYSMQELKAMANENKAENRDGVVLEGQSYLFKTAMNNYKNADSESVK